MNQWRKILFWCLVVLAVAVLTDPILSVQDILGYDSLTSPVFVNVSVDGTTREYGGDWYVFRSYAMRFQSGTRYVTRSWMLVAAIVGLGAFTSAAIAGQPREKKFFFFPAGVIITAYGFRLAEVLTDMLMAQGICLGHVACDNTAMEFWSGDRFRIIAYLALGAAIVIGGALARKGWGRFVASPPSPAMPAAASAAAVAEERPGAPERASENPTERPTLATATALT